MWVLIGSYAAESGAAGGITVFEFDAESGVLTQVDRAEKSLQAGYMVHDGKTGTVYCVDERKTAGRGPVGPAAAVHSFSFDDTGVEAWSGEELRWSRAHFRHSSTAIRKGGCW